MNTGLEIAAKATILKTTTSATGATYVAVGVTGGGPVECAQISIYNGTGVELQFGYAVAGDASPTGQTFEVPDGASFGFRGLKHSTQLLVRRTDQSNTQVTFKAIAEAL